MDERSRDDEVKLPEERVEDLELADDDSAEVSGGLSLNYAKVEHDYKPQTKA